MSLPKSPDLPASEGLQLGVLRPFQAPVFGKASWQVVSTFALYLLCMAAMYACIHVSILLTFAIAIPTGGLIVRIFMLQHDCGHNSLFPSHRLNGVVGVLCSFVTFTPFSYWRRLHARHHGGWNDLDGRGIPADFFSDCATVREYGAMTTLQKRLYRVTHHPILAHFLLPPLIFIVLYRLPFDTPASCRRERVSVYALNLALAFIFGGLIMVFGVWTVMLVNLPAMILAAIAGIWLFSVQHRFEESQWARKEDWNFVEASLHGASHLVLPRVLQWFSGNIGFHHIHHLRPGIPNYRLEACQDGCPDVTSRATRLTLKDALKAPSFVLWDEDLKRMVPFPSR